MAEKMIKFLMFTWFEEGEPLIPGDPPVALERIARLGEVVDITNPAYVKRGEELGAFFTDEEREAVENGAYRGEDAEQVYGARQRLGQEVPAGVLSSGHGEFDLSNSTSDEVAEYISENNLTVSDTLALLPEDATVDDVNRLLDAENLATNNDPRAGVVGPLEKKLTQLSSG